MISRISAISISHQASWAGVLPEVQSRPLEQATMRLYRLIGKFARDGRLDQLMEINEDGIITAEASTA